MPSSLFKSSVLGENVKHFTLKVRKFFVYIYVYTYIFVGVGGQTFLQRFDSTNGSSVQQPVLSATGSRRPLAPGLLTCPTLCFVTGARLSSRHLAPGPCEMIIL